MKLSGYKLHLQRLGFPKPSSSIRTIKYQLGNLRSQHNKRIHSSVRFDRTDLENSLAKKIKHDYEKLYGAFNLTTYLENHCNQVDSIKDFWLDLLRAGVMLRSSRAKTVSSLSILTGEEDKIDQAQKKKMQDVNPEFYHLIDFAKFKDEVLLKKEFRQKNTLPIFKKDVDIETIEKLTKEILTKTNGYSRADQAKYWKSIYGADRKLYQGLSDAETTTFYLLPQIQFRKSYQNPSHLIEDIRNDYRRIFKNENLNIEEYVGIDGQSDGLSEILGDHFKSLINCDYKQIQHKFNSMSDLWKKKDVELLKRLEFLSERAVKIGNPLLVDSWKEYRTDFGGKIKSWMSNSVRQEDEISNTLFGKYHQDHKDKYKNVKSKLIPINNRLGGHYEELQQINNIQSDDRYDADQEELLKECQEISDRLHKYLQGFVDNFDKLRGYNFKYQDLENYRRELPDLRIALNQLHQGDKQLERADRTYKTLFKKDVENIPSFLGYTKSEPGGVYDKYVQSLPRIYSGINFIENTLRQQGSKSRIAPQVLRADIIKSALQKILDRWRIISVNNGIQNPEISRQIIEVILNTFICGDIRQISSQNYIYQSKYKARQLDEKYQLQLNFDDEILIKQIFQLINLMTVYWSKYQNVETCLHEWGTFIELEKIRTGLLAKVIDFRDIKFNDSLKKHFPNVQIMRERLDNTQSSIERILQEAILSEMKGIIAKMTTKKMIARYVVQPVESEKKFKLVTEVSEYKTHRSKNQSYYIHYRDSSINRDIDLDKNNNFHYFAEKDIKDKITSSGKEKKVLKFSEQINKSELIRINSSKYQLQFLDNAISGVWQNYNPAFNSYSLIYEHQLEISWHRDSLQPKIIPSNNYALFVAIPFGLTGDKSNEQEVYNRIDDRFLGIDVGEYGLATSILNVEEDNNSAKILQPEFIYSTALRKIKLGIAENKEQQKAGTFSIPNTYVQRLRGQAITSIRNQVHAIVVKSKALPIYERSISNFETGSGRISKIYKSVKSSDIFEASKENKLKSDLVWGKNKPKIAYEISAYATSYSCCHCFNSIYALRDSDDVSVVVDTVFSGSKDNTSQSHSKIKMKVQNSQQEYYLYGFYRGRNPILKGDQMAIEDMIKCARKYSRPPYTNLDFSFEQIKNLSKYYKKLPDKVKKLKSNQTERQQAETVLKYYAGTQAIFRCPFEDCKGELSDADLQASIWIALKGYIEHLITIYYSMKNKNNKSNQYVDARQLTDREKEIFNFILDGQVPNDKQKVSYKLSKLLELAKQLKISPIAFRLERRLPVMADPKE
ncbi:MAG: type V CRISPR-associated protein Cas12d [Candidatus Saccharibacteria bacterium]|nr:type V CRISPR-associated protein Cas12d [Candidatus Saccharibacteria bacterium]